jgi:uncharacterized membrane protein
MKKIETILWPLFLIWSSCGLLTILFQIDQESLQRSVSIPALQSFGQLCLAWGDFLFHLLAAANLLFAVARSLSWRKTWISFTLIALLSSLVETLGALTGVPFGDYHYTHRMGPMLAGVLPLAIPLAWWNILAPLYLLLRWFRPRLSPRLSALFTAALATLMDWIMEPFAWKIQGYWIWESGQIPLQNYLGWFFLSFILCRLSPLYSPYRTTLDRRLIAVPSLLLLYFITARFIHGL